MRESSQKLRVLVACEFSGIVRDAFIARGHDAWSCDLLPTEKEGPHIQGDVLSTLDQDWDLMIAHPPCTYLCTTGNKWFKPEFQDRFPDRIKRRAEAVSFFLALANAPIPHIAIENPVGIMSSIYRKPDQIIQPFQFGHVEAKKTCLWLKNLDLLRFGPAPARKLWEDVAPSSTEIVEPEYTTFASGKRMPTWYATAKAKNRAQTRSRTFENIATAMAEQWDLA